MKKTMFVHELRYETERAAQEGFFRLSFISIDFWQVYVFQIPGAWCLQFLTGGMVDEMTQMYLGEKTQPIAATFNN